MLQRSEDEPAEHRSLGPDVIAATAPVREFILRIDAVIIARVNGLQRVRCTEMIQHEIHDDREASLMAGPH